MIRRKNLVIILVALAVVLALPGLLMPWVVARAQESPDPQQAETATDTIEFDAEFQAEETVPELVGQYAWTSLNGQVVDSAYSTEPQSMVTVGDACVYGGAGAGCQGAEDVASATTVNGTMNDLAEQRRLLGLVGVVYAGAQVPEAITTGARCSIGENGVPEGEAQQPTGEIAYGGAGLLGGLPDESINLADMANGQSFDDDVGVGALLNLLFALNVEVEIETNWGWDEENLRAYSEVSASYLIRDGDETLSQDSFTARSECGMRMSDGTGSTSPAGMNASTMAAPQALRLAEPEGRPITASGAPQQAGFTTEDSLITDAGVEYHLLSTRELDLLDREAVAQVLAAARETDGVEGEAAATRWWFYSAEAAGEQVPVLEIEFADGAVTQVRPALPGVELPAPDVMAPDVVVTSTRTTPSRSETLEPITSTQVTTSQQSPEPTSTSAEPTPTTTEESENE